MAGSQGTGHEIHPRNIEANSINVTVSAVRIIHDSVNTLPFLVEHTGDVSSIKPLSPLQEIEKILVDRKARFPSLETFLQCLEWRKDL